MFLGGLISWWYGRGWLSQWKRVGRQLSATLEFFSIGQLFTSLFSPFRQISANTASDGSFGASIRAFGDQLLSRIIGAFIRFFTIIIGLLVIMFQSLYGIVIMTVWWVLPILPIAGFILFAIGWVPSWR